MSVSDLANRIGVSRVALYHLFKGNYSRDMLSRVSEALSIPVHVLLAPYDDDSEAKEGCNNVSLDIGGSGIDDPANSVTQISLHIGFAHPRLCSRMAWSMARAADRTVV